jgi:2-C-methyl-D-erythritol 4-phosphate cytidylyltransferase
MAATDVGVILGAAGSATRYGKPKQLEELGGVPIYLHVARTFALIPALHTLVVVGRQEDLPEMEKGLAGLSVNWQLCAGGSTRQESVGNGLQVLSAIDNVGIVLVHDVARALIDEATILSVIGATREYGSAIPGIEVVDTIKRVVGNEIVDTVSRENLWRAQTPQGARKELLVSAYEAARDAAFQGTDESQLLERIGEQPHIVPGNDMNFKITYPADLERARQALIGE